LTRESGNGIGLIALPVAGLAVLIAFVVGIAAATGGPGGCVGEAAPAPGTLKGGVPKRLIPIYVAASTKYSLGSKGPAMLASINFNETSFGSNMNNTTGSGAEGWMMFMPATWATYGVDANRDGRKDPFDPEDAIFAAARYLRASGAPRDWRAAVFAYNHADWYVERIFGDFRRFLGRGLDAIQAPTSALAACVSEGATNERVAKMVAEADRLSGLRPTTEYVRGGSHGVTPTPRNGPFDCSSAVSHLLQVAGFKAPTMDTIALLGWARPGPGRWVTIFDKPYGPEAHTFIRFSVGVTSAQERYWGTSGFVAPGHGPGWIPEATFSASYLSGFRQLHPPGL
jgi:transglycosylase-like protein with SLT domain